MRVRTRTTSILGTLVAAVLLAAGCGVLVPPSSVPTSAPTTQPTVVPPPDPSPPVTPTPSPSPSETSTATRPNVVVIMTDDQRADDVPVMPSTRELIGGQGTTFRNMFVSYPLCCPSRASYLTGQYSHNSGVQDNRPPFGGYVALDGSVTFPAALQGAGYHTAHIGKYLNGYGADDPTEVPPGWDDWYGSIDPSTYNFNRYQLNENGTPKTYTDYQTDHYADLAQDLIRERAQADEPFFLDVGFLAPHSQSGPETPNVGGVQQAVPAPRHAGRFAGEPLPQPPSFDEADTSDKPAGFADRPRLTPEQVDGITAAYRVRRESLLAVDEAVAAIVETLEETGELDDTVLVFTSDNGFFQGEHRFPNGKVHLYDEATRVPLMVRGPGFASGAVQDAMVGNVDLAPTILQLAGAEALVEPDGRSLLPLLRDPAAAWGPRDLLLENGPSGREHFARAVRTAEHLYVEHDTGERELYDVAADPYQLQSRHDDPAYDAVEDTLAQRLAQLQTCRAETCR